MTKNLTTEFALYLGRPSGFGNFTEWELRRVLEDLERIELESSSD